MPSGYNSAAGAKYGPLRWLNKVGKVSLHMLNISLTEKVGLPIRL